MKRHNFEDVSRQTFTHHPNLCMVLDCLSVLANVQKKKKINQDTTSSNCMSLVHSVQSIELCEQ